MAPIFQFWLERVRKGVDELIEQMKEAGFIVEE